LPSTAIKPKTPATSQALAAWLKIPTKIDRAVKGLDEKELDAIRANDLSLRETVHHIVESNLVASNIVLAALASKEEPTYDWSWVYPDAAWMRRLGYDRLPIVTSLDLLRALGSHVAALIEASPDALSRRVKLLDAPGAKLYSKSVAENPAGRDWTRREAHQGRDSCPARMTRKADVPVVHCQ
jgi:hypothetical protein